VVTPVPLEDSPLARALEEHAYRPAHSWDGTPTVGAGGVASGYLTADQYRQAVPLEASNPYAYQKPLMGM
jgi:hypothetical protein